MLILELKSIVKIGSIDEVKAGKVYENEIISSDKKIYLFSPEKLLNIVSVDYIKDLQNSLTDSIYHFNHTNFNGSGVNSIFFDKFHSLYYQVINRIDNNKFREEYYLAIYNHDFTLKRIVFLTKENNLHKFRDETITLNGINFSKPRIINNTQKIVKSENIDANFRFVLTKDIYLKLSNYPLQNNDDKKYFFSLAHQLQKKFPDKKFLPADILKILNFFRKKTYLQDRLDCCSSFDIENLLKGKIVGFLKKDDTNFNNLIIHLSGEKYLHDKIICFNLKKNEINWQIKTEKNISQVILEDIDNDNTQEIILAQNSFTEKPAADYFSIYDNVGSNVNSELIIYDANGKIKRKRNKNLIFKIGNNQKNNIKPYFTYLSKFNTIIAGVGCDENDFIDDSLRIINLNNHNMIRSDIKISNIKHIESTNGTVTVFENSENDLIKSDYFYDSKSGDLEEEKVSKISSFYSNGNSLREQPLLKINRKKYYISDPFKIYDESLNLMLSTDYSFRNIVKLNRNIFLSTGIEYEASTGFKESIKKIKLVETKETPTFLIFLFIFEIILLIIIHLIRFEKLIPNIDQEKKILIMYTFPGDFNLIRFSKDVNKIFNIPSKLGRGHDRFYKLMDKIDQKAYFYDSADFGIYGYTIYKLETVDENDIIRRISHDLKNSFLDLKLTTRNLPEFDENKTILKIINDISKNSVTLSRFVALLGKVKKDADLNEIIYKIYQSYIHHPSFNKIKIDSIFKNKSNISIDSRILTEVIRVLLDNAIYEYFDNDNFWISIDYIEIKNSNKKGVKISNKISRNIDDSNILLNSGYTTKDNHSGTGLSIAKNLSEMINADFEISVNEGIFSVVILFG